MSKALWKKAWLVKKLLPSTGLETWVFTTRKQKTVLILGQAVANASYSEFTPGVVKTSTEKIHTIFCNDMTDELAQQYKANASGNVFYMGITLDDDEPVGVITPDEYSSIQSEEQDSIPAAPSE